MRDILPFYFNRLEGEVIYVDPKNELKRLRQAVVRNDRKNPRAIYCGDHKQANINLMGKPGQGKMVYPIEDEAHSFYNPETEKIASKLMELGRTRKNLSEGGNTKN